LPIRLRKQARAESCITNNAKVSSATMQLWQALRRWPMSGGRQRHRLA